MNFTFIIQNFCLSNSLSTFKFPLFSPKYPLDLSCPNLCLTQAHVLNKVVTLFTCMQCRQDVSIWGGTRGKESTCQCRRSKRYGFDPWVRKIPWSRIWYPTPVFLPGKFQGQRSLVVYSPWGCQGSDTAEWLKTTPPWLLKFMLF